MQKLNAKQNRLYFKSLNEDREIFEFTDSVKKHREVAYSEHNNKILITFLDAKSITIWCLLRAKCRKLISCFRINIYEIMLIVNKKLIK